MATCKWCGKTGWLLRISRNEMCDVCEALEVPVIVRQVQILQESQRLVKSGKTLNTRVGRCDDVIRIATELMPYEEKGITVVAPPASELRSRYIREREEIVTDYLTSEVLKILSRAELKATPKAAISEATKAVTKLDEARNEFGVDNPMLDDLEQGCFRFMHKTELEGYLSEAEKAEFKGNRKKALDQYQEALFFLKKKWTAGEPPVDQVEKVEAKIRELSGY